MVLFCFCSCPMVTLVEEQGKMAWGYNSRPDKLASVPTHDIRAKPFG
jgi:hypothetical protein